MAKTVLIADDHPIFRVGLHHILQQENHFNCLEVSDGDQAITQILEHQPDFAILDINMPGKGGLDVIQNTIHKVPSTRFIVLTVYDDYRLMERAFDLGAQAYLLKEDAETELLQCLKHLENTQRYLSQSMTRQVNHLPQQRIHDQLTPAEKRILHLVGQFKTSREIADSLNISIRTVQNHRNHIVQKLDLQGNNALLHFALSGGLSRSAPSE